METNMQAEKVILKTDSNGRLVGIPQLPENRHIEAIFLILDEKGLSNKTKRHPHPELAGRVKITGDILDSAPTSAWDLS